MIRQMGQFAGAVFAAMLLVAMSQTAIANADDAVATDTKAIQLPGVTSAAESAADKVFITGQPTKETLEALAKKGVKVVVNLRRLEETTKLAFDEKSAVAALGMTYISVPVNTSLPKEEVVKSLLDTLGSAKETPVLLHCSSGNRAGAIWALYSGVRKGQPVDVAIAEGRQAGMTNEALEHVVRNRITATAQK